MVSGAIALLAGVPSAATLAADSEPELTTIRAPDRVPFSTCLPQAGISGAWELISAADGGVWGLGEVLPGPDEEGKPLASARLVVLPRHAPGGTPDAAVESEKPGGAVESEKPGANETAALIRLSKRIDPAAAVFQWKEASDTTLELTEGTRPVLAYNFGVITRDDVPESDPRRSRSCYVHPLYGLDGEVLTDDFPKDHYHHHGVFWTWPHVVIDGKEYSLWEDRGPLRQRFVRWLCREAGATAAVLGVENGWFLGDAQVLTERVWFTVYRSGGERHIDVDLFFIPLDREVTLWGAEGKSYGGLTVRFRPRPGEKPRITVADGLTADDLYETPLTWADFCARFGEGEVGKGAAWSGAAIFISPSHPDYPPTWLTRHYGPLCVGWPGIRSQTLSPGKPVHLPYRLWIHRDCPSAEDIETVYRAYCKISATESKAK
ncbi:MAG: hypothetical protein GYA33_03505 [Thermogutta sp.]|nr:hypothetical protein [Thermogutta sp.]